MADVGKATIVFELKVDLPRIQEAVEKVRAALAEFGETCSAAGVAMSAMGLGPEIGSLWRLRGAGYHRFQVIEPSERDLESGPAGVIVQRLDGPQGVERHSVADFHQRFLPHPDGALLFPAPGSAWEFADDRDPGGIWRVDDDYSGGNEVLELRRIDGPPAQNGDVSASWQGTVASHNRFFRRSNV